MSENENTKAESTGSSGSFDLQIRMFEKGADAIQSHIGRIDEILFKIKASSVTVWVALIGWGLTQENPAMIPLGAISIIGFWLLEGYFRGIQSGFIEASLSITAFVNDREAIQHAFSETSFPANTVYPMTFRVSEFAKARRYGKGLIAPSVAILYLFLLFINYLVWISYG